MLVSARPSSVVGLAFASLLAPAALGQRLLYQVDGAAAYERFGQALDTGGHVGGTNAADIFVASMNRATAVDGSDGATLRTLHGTPPFYSAIAVAFVDDLDGDGVDELLVGDPNWAPVNQFAVGRVLLYSGGTGQHLQSVFGNASAALLGISVDGLADLDGDGRSELLIGSPGHEQAGLSNAGRVQVLSGIVGAPLFEAVGTQTNQYLGWRVRALADLDLDGIADFAASAPFENNGSALGVGRVRVYSGATSSVLLQVTGTPAKPAIGQSLAATGDVDRDGVPDLAIGTYSHDRAALVSGSTGDVLVETEAPQTQGSEWFGWALSGHLDFNSDAVPDIAVGAPLAVWGYPFEYGRALVFSGRDGRVLFDAYGDQDESEFGWAVAGLADLDDDGADELVVGAPRHDLPGLVDTGIVRVYASEPGIQSSLYGKQGEAKYGSSLINGGDVDGDGIDDLIVGAPFEDGFGPTNSGAVHFVSGRTGMELHIVRGNSSNELLGNSIAVLGDLDGDGVSEIACGGPGPASASTLGVVRIVSGATGAVLLGVHGPFPNSSFGYAVANAGDFDGDGYPDVLVGAPNHSASFANGGTAQIFSSVSGTLLLDTPSALTGTNHQYGESVCGLGDVDGDSVPDFAVGAPGAGYVHVRSGADASVVLRTYLGGPAGDEFGEPVVDVGDLDGDGVRELAIGRRGYQPTLPPPNDWGAAGAGQVQVFSGATGAALWAVPGSYTCPGNLCNGERLGSAIAGIGDQDCDGVRDVLIASDAGSPRVVSGADGSTLHTFPPLGATFGSAAARAGDCNGDGRDDVAFSSVAWKHGPAANCGAVKVYSLNARFLRPKNYCAAKANTLGCTPSIGYSGSPSVAGACDDFHVHASQVIGQTSGRLLWSTQPNPPLFPVGSLGGSSLWAIDSSQHGGIQCVFEPSSIGRYASGGTAGQCDGTFDFHFGHAFLASQSLLAGQSIYAQWWYADPLHPDGSGIGHTDALEFTLVP